MSLWTPDAERLPGTPWAMAGLSAPIPEYTTLIDITASPHNGDPTGDPGSVAVNDAAYASAIAALAVANSAIYFPEGHYAISQISHTNNGGFGIKGDGQDLDTGEWLSRLSVYNAPGVILGQDGNYNSTPEFVPYATFSADKGDTEIEIEYAEDSAPFVAGLKLCRVLAGYDQILPATSGNGIVQRYVTVQVTGVSGTTLTLSRPLPFAMVDAVIQQAQLASASLIRMEGLRIDGSATLMQVGIQVGSSVDIELRNMRVDHHDRYALSVQDVIGLSVKSCWIGESEETGPSHAGILVNGAYSSRFADNIVELNFPCWEINSCTTASVFRDNLSVEAGSNLGMDINHGAQNTMNLFQHNMTPTMVDEGYHGGSDHNTIFGNWITGNNAGVELQFSLAFKRWAYKHCVANNLLLSPGQTAVTPPFRTGACQPNLGNSSAFGTASIRGAKGILTTRTSDTAGVITADSADHDVIASQLLDVVWSEGANPLQNGVARRRMLVGTVAGTVIPVSAGTGDVLPAQDAVVHFPTTNSAAYAPWFNWNTALSQPRYWTGTLTERTDDRQGVVTLDPGMAADLTEHFNRSIWSATTPGSLPHEGTSGMGGGGIFVGNIHRTSIVGDELTFFNASQDLMVEGSTVTITPSALGFQEMDMQVLLDLILIGNHNFNDNAIPDAEQLLAEGETFPDSLDGTEAPDYYDDAGTFPPFMGSDASTADPNRLPAFVRWSSFLPLEDSAVGAITLTGTARVREVLTITGGVVTGNPFPTVTYSWYRDGVLIGGETSVTYTIVPLDLGTILTGRKSASNDGGSDFAEADTTEVLPFVGDVLTLLQTTSNTDPVTELVRRAPVVDGVAGTLTYEIFHHSGDYPLQPDNNYVYAKHGSTMKHVFDFEGTITLANAIASRP